MARCGRQQVDLLHLAELPCDGVTDVASRVADRVTGLTRERTFGQVGQVPPIHEVGAPSIFTAPKSADGIRRPIADAPFNGLVAQRFQIVAEA
jgi:hypothetical protein